MLVGCLINRRRLYHICQRGVYVFSGHPYNGEQYHFVPEFCYVATERVIDTHLNIFKNKHAFVVSWTFCGDCVQLFITQRVFILVVQFMMSEGMI